MVFKFALLLIFLNLRNVILETSEPENFIVVSTTDNPDPLGKLDERLKKLEHYLEITNALKQTSKQLESVKNEIVAKLEAIVENKFKTYDAKNENLKKEILTLITAKNENLKKEILTLVQDKTANGLESVETRIVSKVESLGMKLKVYEARNVGMEEEFVSLIKNMSTLSRDCKDVQRRGHEASGIYRIRPEMANENFLVWCDMTTRGGGWTYVINRFDGSQDFYKNWTDYKHGFGKPSGEHWLGLEHLYYLTNSKRNELLVELVDWNSTEVYSTYDHFEIEKESEGYKIASVGAYEGNAGDSLRPHEGYKFSTPDRDQDAYDAGSCATDWGGWWYNNCYNCLLTGKYVKNTTNYTEYDSRIAWNSFNGKVGSLKEARMMIRPIEI